ncbi:MAG: hypothetical protein NC452_11305, partial [Eubacterium sp.]|nr:hypothetical protein [Eubacterium sp.]
FTGSDYDKMQKVYSIWICTNPDKAHENTITKHSIYSSSIFGGNEELSVDKNSDLITLIMICLDNYKHGGESESDIIRLLTVLLSDKINAEEKKKILQNEHGIKMVQNIDEELNNMCNLSRGYFENGLEEGMQKGIQEGTRGIIVRMLKNGKALEEISKDTDMSIEKIKEIAKQEKISS